MIKFLKNLWYFFQIYSFFGLVLLIITLIFDNQILDKVFLTNKVLSQGNIGIDIIPFRYFDFTYNVLIIAALAFATLYFFLFSIAAMLLRYNLIQVIKKYGYTFNQDQNILTIKLNKRPSALFFFIQSKINVFNRTVGKRKVSHIDQPRTTLNKENEFVFDFKDVPTGVYTTNHINLYLQDPFGLLNAKAGFDLQGEIKVLIDHSQTLIYQNFSTSKNIYDSNTSILSSNATESYYNTREYKTGDEIRRIHWKNTAKSGKLIVKLPEDLPVDDRDLNIIINLYSPMIDKIDLSSITSRYIESVISIIKRYLKSPNQNINLYFNNSDEDYIESLNKYNPNKINEMIIDKCLLQKTRTFNQFFAQHTLNNVIVFSMSTDVIAGDDISEKYIYSIRIDRMKNTKSFFRRFFTYEKNNYYGINWKEFLYSYSPIGAFIKNGRNQDFKSIILRNENFYFNDNIAKYINA